MRRLVPVQEEDKKNLPKFFWFSLCALLFSQCLGATTAERSNKLGLRLLEHSTAQSANVLVQEDYRVLPAFNEWLAQAYSAKVGLLNFKTEREIARTTINEAGARDQFVKRA